MEQVSDRRLEQVALKLISEHPEAVALFPAEVFSTIQHQIFYDKICYAHDQGFKLDKNILISFLGENDLLPQVGKHTIDSVFELSYDEEFITDYAQKLKDLSILRKVQLNCYALVEAAPSLSVSDLGMRLKEIQDELYSEVGVKKDNESLAGLVDLELENIFNHQEGAFVRTGFAEFDALIGGIEPSDLMIIAGRPSTGKTSLMIRWMVNFAKAGHSCEILSFEMSNTQIVRRILSMESDIPTHRLKQGIVTDEERANLYITANNLKSLPLSFKYSSIPKIGSLANHIRLSYQANGTKIFAIDYVQLMDVTPGNETTEIARIASVLKSLAKELDVSIILVSQLNRAVEQRKDKHPVLSDLRQSGGLEENADKVLFVYRDYYYTKKMEDHGLAELILAKNRNGPIAVFNTFFNEETTNFSG